MVLSKNARWAAPALVLLALALYAPALTGSLVWDDPGHVPASPDQVTAAGFARVWTDPGATQQYYPLTHTVFRLGYLLWGGSPLGYHLLNVILFGLSAFLLYRVLLRLAVPGAFFGALLFAVHPVCVESAAWISELKNALSGFFFLASGLFLVRSLLPHPEETPPRGAYVAAFVLFLAALLSKTAAGVLPAMMLPVLYWKKGRITGRDLLALAPFFLVAGALGTVTAWSESALIQASGPLWEIPPAGRLILAGKAVWFYAGKALIPLGYSFVYPKFDLSPADLANCLPLALALAVLTSLFLGRKRLTSAPFAGAAAYVLGLVPALGLVSPYPFRYTHAADHFQFFALPAMMGLATGLYFTVSSRLTGPRRAAWKIFGALFLILCAAQTLSLASHYRNAETLWRATLKQNPASFLAHGNLAVILERRGDLARAVEHARLAAEYAPKDAEAWLNLGMILARTGDCPEAAKALDRALRLSPDLAKAWLARGVCRMRGGDFAHAVDDFDRAARLAPDWASAHNNLGVALARAGDLKRAARHLALAARLDPQNPQIQTDLNAIHRLLGEDKGKE